MAKKKTPKLRALEHNKDKGEDDTTTSTTKSSTTVTTTPTTIGNSNGNVIQPEVVDNLPASLASLPVPSSPTLLKPVTDVKEAVKTWDEYQSLRDKLAGPGDFVDIQGKKHPCKQFANKLSRFFGLSVGIQRQWKEDLPDTSFTWHIIAIAIGPNGQARQGDGHCNSKERGFAHIQHDVFATAVTRAKNRAILELVGFGECSAEEIQD